MTDTPQDPVQTAILELIAAQPRGKTVDPSEVAKTLDPENWRRKLKPVRHAANALARDGKIAIYRKGKPVGPDVAPDTVKGVIRLGRPG